MILKCNSFLFALFSLMFSVKSATSILCYDCNSLYDPRCGEEFDSFSLGVVNCSLRDPLEHLPDLESTLCRSIKIDISGKVRVVRQCGYIRDDEEDGSCQRRSGFHEMVVTYCSCSTNLCNSATIPPALATRAVILGLLSYCLM